MRFSHLSDVAFMAGVVSAATTACTNDNILSAFEHYSVIAKPFCSIYTKFPTQTSIPAFAQAFSAVPAELSSACTCLKSGVASVTSSASSVKSSVTSTTSTIPGSTSASSSSSSSSSSSISTTSAYSSNTPVSSSSSSMSLTTSAATCGATGMPATCVNPALSCHNTTVQTDLCCFNAPGGSLLQTQFWDTDPVTGPVDHWTIHGLWPDNCDGTYEEDCDPSRAYTNISAILEAYGKTDLLTYMNEYWQSDDESNEAFWDHEWETHGTCINTLDPSCYTCYQPQEEVVDFFQTVVDLFKTLDTYTFLSDAGIVPSSTVTYSSAEIYDALIAAFGYNVTIGCDDDQLYQVYYYFNTLGSVQTGTFVPTYPDDNSTSCPSTGIQYLPKSSTTATSTTTTATGTSATATATATSTAVSAPYSGKGYLEAYTSGSNDGCLISAGTWYITGTCATYTGTFTDSTNTTFTLKSSKGPCGVYASNGTISCASYMSYTDFTSVDGYLASGGDNLFYAAAVPTGSVQEAVSMNSNTAEVQFLWQAI